MSNNVLIRLNSDGVRELLKSPEMMSACREQAETALSRLGDGYAISEYTGANRVNVSVYTASREAMQENLDSNTILCALGG